MPESEILKTEKYWLETILNECSDKLSDWESNFIESISIRLNYDRPCTDRQHQILERIYAEKTK